MNRVTIKRINEEFSVCKLPDMSQIDFTDEFCFFCKTDQEMSLVCLTAKVPGNATHREDGWRAFRIEGQLDFSLVGILSRITSILAENRIGIFAMSTYNTDYVLIKAGDYERALGCLSAAGYMIISQ